MRPAPTLAPPPPPRRRAGRPRRGGRPARHPRGDARCKEALSSCGYQAFKGTPRLVYRADARTGEEELVRGVERVGTPLSSVSRVLATPFNGYCGAESGYVPVSTVAPAVLMGEIELQRVARASERRPLLPVPWGERIAPPASAPLPSPAAGAAP